jgi:hypothetical protein
MVGFLPIYIENVESIPTLTSLFFITAILHITISLLWSLNYLFHCRTHTRIKLHRLISFALISRTIAIVSQYLILRYYISKLYTIRYGDQDDPNDIPSSSSSSSTRLVSTGPIYIVMISDATHYASQCIVFVSELLIMRGYGITRAEMTPMESRLSWTLAVLLTLASLITSQYGASPLVCFKRYIRVFYMDIFDTTSYC